MFIIYLKRNCVYSPNFKNKPKKYKHDKFHHFSIITYWCDGVSLVGHHFYTRYIFIVDQFTKWNLLGTVKLGNDQIFTIIFCKIIPLIRIFKKFLHGYDNFLWGYVGKGIFFFLPFPFVGAKEKGGLLQSQNMVLSDVWFWRTLIRNDEDTDKSRSPFYTKIASLDCYG